MHTRHQTPSDGPVYRSGAVARLTGINVQTLRVWERRYGIVGPRQSATGQRQYSPDDVRRLTVIKQLVDSGHAIGSIATLDLDTLQSMLGNFASASRAVPGLADSDAEGSVFPLRAVIVGEALAMRVEHFHLPELQVVATPSNAAGGFEGLQDLRADVLLVESPTLNDESAQAIRSWARQVRACKIIVEYSYGPQRIEQELRALGCGLVRAPLHIDELQSLCHLLSGRARIPVSTLVPGVSLPRRGVSTARRSAKSPLHP